MKQGYELIYEEKGTFDLSPLLDYGVAVICNSNEEAMHLISVLKVEHPDLVKKYCYPYTGWRIDSKGYDLCDGQILRAGTEYYAESHIGTINYIELLRDNNEEFDESDINIFDFLKVD